MESDFDDIDWNHPLGYFEYFILKDGFIEFRDKFFTEKNDEGVYWSEYYRPNGNIKPGEEYMLYEDYHLNTLGSIPQKIYFKDELRDRLLLEKKRSFELIAKKIDSLQTKDEINIYFIKLLTRLTSLVEAIKRNPELKKYATILEILYNIVCDLHNTYLPFFYDIQLPL
ncbi:MAG: hypothetical protein WDA19_10825, partial [Mariniphaga sp.]